MRTARILLAAALLAMAVPSLRAEPTSYWRAEDTAPLPRMVYAVEVGSFPSLVLASAVEQTLGALNWSPVWIAENGGRQRVYVGQSPSIAEAHAILGELIAAKVADGVVVEVTPVLGDRVPRPFSGPVLAPFHRPVRDPDPDLSRARVITACRPAGKALPIPEQQVAAAAAIALLEAKSLADVALGDGLVPVLEALRASGDRIEDMMYAAERIARGQWAASPLLRIRAMELCADMYLGSMRDVRAAWTASHALLREPMRTPEGILRDRLRIDALTGLVLAQGESPHPSMPHLRASLRITYEDAESSPRLRGRAALLTLQTFAWEGRWDRVREFGEGMLAEFSADAPLYQVAAVYVARGYEETEEWDRAVKLLDRAVAINLARSERILIGDRLVNAREMASRWQAYFRALESGVSAPPRPPEILFEASRSDLAPEAESLASEG